MVMISDFPVEKPELPVALRPYHSNNLIAIVVGYPAWMSDDLRTALKMLVEERAAVIEGLYNGYVVSRDETGFIQTKQYDSRVSIEWYELTNKVVNKTLEAWVTAAMAAQTIDPEVMVGLDIVFVEPDYDFKAVIESWKGVDLFPDETGRVHSRGGSENTSNDSHSYGIGFSGEVFRNDEVAEEAAEVFIAYSNRRTDILQTEGYAVPLSTQDLIDTICGKVEYAHLESGLCELIAKFASLPTDTTKGPIKLFGNTYHRVPEGFDEAVRAYCDKNGVPIFSYHDSVTIPHHSAEEHSSKKD